MITVVDGALYQWDTGRKLQFDPKEGQTANEIHIAYQGDQTALVLELDELNQVLVPDIMLQQTDALNVWVVLYHENGERTTEGRLLTILPRARPMDYVYTRTEVKRWEDLEDRICALEKGGNSNGGYVVGLPDVTEEDNGKTLFVEDGKWVVGKYPFDTGDDDENPSDGTTDPAGGEEGFEVVEF